MKLLAALSKNNALLQPAGYIRRSSPMQADNFSLEAQKRAIIDECKRRNLPEPVFYIDDELSARGEQIAKRPAFQKLLKDVMSGRIKVVIVHTLDRWSRNVAVTLESFRILSESQTAFISVSEHIDYSTPEGRLQLTILAAFAAYFSDMLAKHVSKGKGERAHQGLFNGDIPYGYRYTGKKTPSEQNPETFPGLRMIGELRMQGLTASQIAGKVNAAGYRIRSKRYGDRLFTSATINAMMQNSFYAAFAPGDDHGTVLYKGEKYRGQHLAAFTYQEWERIRQGSKLNYNAPHRAASSHIYAFSGYASCVYCGTTLRATGQGGTKYSYYKDTARERHICCPTPDARLVRKDRVVQQFGELLQGIQLSGSWQEMVQQQLLAVFNGAGGDGESSDKERGRLTLKRQRVLKQHREGYIDDNEFELEIASVDLALRQLDSAQAQNVDGLSLDDVLELGEKLPEIASLWDVATVEEQREWVTLLVEPNGLAYDLKAQNIASLTARPAFAPLLRLQKTVNEYSEAPGVFVSSFWRPTTPHPRDQFRSRRSARGRSDGFSRARYRG
jgi:DNA invertase Pin-like site-specific DNA recombinase